MADRKEGKERPSTSSGRAEGGPPTPDLAQPDVGRVQPNKGRRLQVARTGGRKLFDAAAQAVFLEWFAATCNVSWSAERAGFNHKTVLRHRMNDPHFREGWERALAQGYARLEAKQLETKRKEVPIGIEGDWDAPEMDDMDPLLRLQILREHKREIAGVRKPGRRPRVASNIEVREALVIRLRAFGIRVSGEDGGAGSDD
jgi:hypothetical protein